MIMSILELGIIFAAGLVVGWNFLPQPQWVKDLMDKIRKD